MKKYTIKNVTQATDTGSEESGMTTTMELDGPEIMSVSDGYHTMDELYDHRISLWITLCRIRYESTVGMLGWSTEVWRSKNHSDGEPAFGGTWFVLGIGKEAGKQITYHLPIALWDKTYFAETLDKAPEWDGHTSNDVLERLKNI